jgi:hypothetical protein
LLEYSLRMPIIGLEQVLRMLRQSQGDRTAKEFAGVIGISAQYLSDVYSRRRLPGPIVLSHLNLERSQLLYQQKGK